MSEPNRHPEQNPDPASKQEPETFTREYVQELREENKSWRQKHQEAEAARREKEAEIGRLAKAADDKVSAAQRAADERILRVELKAAALKAGMIDPDGLKLADLSAVTLDDDGVLLGAEALLEQLKAAKPYLFGAVVINAASSTTAGKPPAPKGDEKVDAAKMSKEEYQAARKRLLGGR